MQNVHLQTVTLHWKLIPLAVAQLTLQTHGPILSITSRMQQPKQGTNNRFHSGSLPPFPSYISPQNTNTLIHSQIPRLVLRLQAAELVFPGKNGKTRQYRILTPVCTSHPPDTQIQRAAQISFSRTHRPMLSMIPTPPPALNRATAFLPSMRNRPAHRLPTVLPSPSDPTLRQNQFRGPL